VDPLTDAIGRAAANAPFLKGLIARRPATVARLAHDGFDAAFAAAMAFDPALPVAERLRAAKAERLSQLDDARIAFFTSRLSLTQDQAQRFWPLQNEFITRRRELNRTGRLLKREQIAALTDQQIRDDLTQTYATRQQELNLEKEYFDKFQKVLSLRQVAQLMTAERDFTREVIRRVARAPGAVPPAN